MSNPVLLGVVSMKPLAGNMVMEMASNLGFAIVDRLLGGTGTALDKERDFSEIELTIIERIFSICVNLLKEPWENVIKVTPRLERIETNSQFAQIISPTETIAIITINLEPVMDKLNTKFWFSNMQEKDPTMYGEVIENVISKTKVPIKAILGESKVNVSDFVNLQIGDIIKIDKKVDQELDVYVGNIKKFNALPGYFEDKYAVRITDVIREESE